MKAHTLRDDLLDGRAPPSWAVIHFAEGCAMPRLALRRALAWAHAVGDEMHRQGRHQLAYHWGTLAAYLDGYLRGRV